MTQARSHHFPDNTALHDAIHLNQTDLALRLIPTLTLQELNHSSLGNTALLFAIKKGNISVAEALLAILGIDVFARDQRKLTALHWACMLRQDKLITRLLDLNADPHDVVQPWVDLQDRELKQKYEMSPFVIYCRNVFLFNFTFYFSAAMEENLSEDNVYYDYFYRKQEKGEAVRMSSFADNRSDLCIPGEMPYTDIIFHMKELCENLNWGNHVNRKFAVHGIDFRETADVFRKNFGMGITDFCHFRNAIPVNARIVERMQAAKLIFRLPPPLPSETNPLALITEAEEVAEESSDEANVLSDPIETDQPAVITAAEDVSEESEEDSSEEAIILAENVSPHPVETDQPALITAAEDVAEDSSEEAYVLADDVSSDQLKQTSLR